MRSNNAGVTFRVSEDFHAVRQLGLPEISRWCASTLVRLSSSAAIPKIATRGASR